MLVSSAAGRGGRCGEDDRQAGDARNQRRRAHTDCMQGRQGRSALMGNGRINSNGPRPGKTPRLAGSHAAHDHDLSAR